MFFNSIDFAVFFPIVFFLYWTFFRKKLTLRNIFLIIVSYIFYGWWDWRFLSLIILSSLIDFISGQKIYKETNQIKRKKWLLLSLIVNLGILGFFKYYNFFVESFISAFSVFGASLEKSTLNIILPVGISFYTFQTLSYSLDIYFKKLKPTDNIICFFAFVSFFPQLVAGPIERAKNMLPQFSKLTKIEYDDLRSGLLIMTLGFFKKIVISDRLAIFVDATYGNISEAKGGVLIISIIFFAFQLYLDFSAYSEIAIGSARILGFKLSTNFRRPYLSNSFSEFWKRWHITLSSWFKDYVFIPLGGSRVSNNRRIINIFIVFVVSGLWHGASWNFVIWGALNGLFVILFDGLLKNGHTNIIKKIISVLFVNSLWALSLIFFRAQTLKEAITIFSQLFSRSSIDLYNFGLNTSEFKFIVWLLLFYISFEILLEKSENFISWFTSRHIILRWIVYTLIVSSIIMLGSYGLGIDDKNFIYFQF